MIFGRRNPEPAAAPKYPGVPAAVVAPAAPGERPAMPDHARPKYRPQIGRHARPQRKNAPEMTARKKKPIHKMESYSSSAGEQRWSNH